MKAQSNLILLTCSAVAALLISCGGGGIDDVAGPNPAAADLQLKVYDESYLGSGPGTEFQVRQSSRGTFLDATISTTGAVDLKALCLELDYDPTVLTPLRIDRHPQLQGSLPERNLLELERLDLPGTVHYAHMQDISQAGFSGSSDLLTVRFLQAPMSDERTVSAPPSAAHSVPELSGSITTGNLQWYYRNRGDYDQNGEVNVADITQLGVKLGTVSETPGEPFDISAVEWQVDGDENGNINISDITPLGANIGNSVSGGYNIYTSELEADYPDTDNSFTNGAGTSLVATVGGVPPLSEADNFDMKSSMHLHFTYELGDPLPGKYFWVRPTDSSSEGIPSTLVGPLSVENIPLPVIESIDILEVVVGDTIVVTGTGFGIKDAEDKITINDLELEVVSWTNSTITAKIPVGAGDGPLVVTTLRTSDPSTDELNVIPATPGQPDGNTV